MVLHACGNRGSPPHMSRWVGQVEGIKGLILGARHRLASRMRAHQFILLFFSSITLVLLVTISSVHV